MPAAPEQFGHDGEEGQKGAKQNDAPVQVKPNQDEEEPEGNKPEPTPHPGITVREQSGPAMKQLPAHVGRDRELCRV